MLLRSTSARQSGAPWYHRPYYKSDSRETIMATYAESAEQGFSGAEGRFQGAFNSTMSSGDLDGATLTNLIAGLQRQAQGLQQLARAVSDLDSELQSIK